MSTRMDPAHLQTVREALGLTHDALARILGVRSDTLRRWESGREPIPYAVREEIQNLEDFTHGAVVDIVDDATDAIRDGRDPVVAVFRSDEHLHAARPDLERMTARWWRHVVHRAAERVPLAIVTATRPDQT